MNTQRTIETLNTEYQQIEVKIQNLKGRQRDILNQISEIAGSPAQINKSQENQPRPTDVVIGGQLKSIAIAKSKKLTAQTYNQRVKGMASEFFGQNIQTKSELKRLITDHPKTTLLQVRSLQQSGNSFYRVAESQINHLKALKTTENLKITTVQQLSKLSKGQLRGLARWHKLAETGTPDELAARLHGLVTDWEMKLFQHN